MSLCKAPETRPDSTRGPRCRSQGNRGDKLQQHRHPRAEASSETPLANSSQHLPRCSDLRHRDARENRARGRVRQPHVESQQPQLHSQLWQALQAPCSHGPEETRPFATSGLPHLSLHQHLFLGDPSINMAPPSLQWETYCPDTAPWLPVHRPAFLCPSQHLAAARTPHAHPE